MSEFHRCPECGNYLAPYAMLVAQIMRVIMKEQSAGKDPERIIFDSNVTIELHDLFDALRIPLQCCRMHLFTKVDFTEMYK